VPFFVVAALAAQSAPKQAAITTIAAKTAGMKHIDGYFPLDWDAKEGKLFLEVPRLKEEFLYTQSLPYGTGSNDLGLDRGKTSPGLLVRFERIGNKVLLMQANMDFRSSSSDAAEQLAVRQSFPESVLFGFTVAAEDAGGAVLVDASEFFLRDSYGVAEDIADVAKRTKKEQGTYKLDTKRSAIATEDTKGFPNNTEVESILTFTSENPVGSSYVSDVTPDPHALTVRERQSLVKLPEPGFTPRRFDTRAGMFSMSYRDYTAPLDEPMEQMFVRRHRLIKRDTNCRTNCEAVAPIQYYVDRGAPEPIRTALLEGARWWDQAFQAAGWAKGTFRVDILPADADPMDVRYNIIQWVHRYTRGWSYGAEVADPRTGEILKGNVTLGSLRGRQDYLIAEGLLSPYVTGKKITPENDPMLAMTLQRIRQLAAHETGHTLGLAHNFAASAFGTTEPNGTSVMDYPHPYVALGKDGVPDLSHAYAVNIGEWDKVAITYGYREFDKGGKAFEDGDALNAVLTDSQKRGLVYITDQDARPFSGAHPHAHLWDNGADPADELNRMLVVRSAALARFGENAIKPGTPMAQLEDSLVPLFLIHRYQTEAAIKEIGGLDYRYAVRGDGQLVTEVVDPVQQKKALAAVLKTLAPDTLTLPEPLLKMMPPRPPGLPRTQESFASHTGVTFDPVAAAESAADLTLAVLLNPARASRLIEYHMRVPASPSLRGVLEAVSKTTAERPEGGHTMSSEVERAVEFRALEAMMALAVNPQASTQARAIALSHINDVLKAWTTAAPLEDTAEAIHRSAMIARVEEFKRDPAKFVPAKAVEAPAGMPIGEGEDFE
jgi:hypothetical protein